MYENLIDAIDRYIAKADDDLKDTLKDEGFEEADDLVGGINNLEDHVTEALESEQTYILDQLQELFGDKDVDGIMDALAAGDVTAVTLATVFKDEFQKIIEAIANTEIKIYDADLFLETLTDKTKAWIETWSVDLADIMQLDSHDKIRDVLTDALTNGDGIETVVINLIDSYSFSRTRARRTAITEMLTAHSVAAQEAITQSPAVDKKEWKHTGAHKNQPRPHHVAMDGQIVGKDESFTIDAPTGTYKALFPRDPMLPASERVNCHCISRGVVKDDVLGLSLEERRQMQKDLISDSNTAWEAELDAGNKSQAGIE